MLDLITILGPTASGKTSLAVALAAHLDTEIISADSRQIYRSMDIGTGKDLSEYTYEGHAIPYHLIDICPPGYKYNLFEYIRDYNTAYADIIKRGKTPILCGGTGLYIEAVLKGYSLPPVPENKALREKLAEKSLSELEEILKNYKTLHNQTDTDTCKRAIRAIEIAEYYSRQEPEKLIPNPVKNALIIGVNIDRETDAPKFRNVCAIVSNKAWWPKFKVCSTAASIQNLSFTTGSNTNILPSTSSGAPHTIKWFHCSK